MFDNFKRPLAAIALLGLAACGGNGSTPSGNPNPIQTNAPPTTSVGTLVGVGDSLTAGYQSSGFLGDPSATAPGISAYPNAAVPPGQMFGFFADIYQQATGKSAADPLYGPLPLIKAPGLGGQLVLNAATIFAASHSSCDSFNNQAYSLNSWQNTRMNPGAGITDLGVPGITMHEAITMTAPLTGAPTGNGCGYPAIPGDPTSGNLQSLVQGESLTFYPVLGSFETHGPTTELQAAVALKPNLTTVLLGANDLLKYTFSGGLSPVTDTPQQLGTDLGTIIAALKGAGSKVLVGNLPTVLSTPQFFPVSTAGNANKLANDFTVLLAANGVPIAVAPAYASAMVTSIASNPKIGGATSGWYLTESGFFAAVQQAATQIQGGATPAQIAIQLDPSGAGSGDGAAYLDPVFAAQVAGLNAAYNQAIAAAVAASGSNVALVDLNTVFATAATSGYTVAPGETMTLQFGGGLLSFDGLHPSNVGYAVMANAFIATSNAAFGTTIPQLTAAQIATIANGNGSTIPADPYNPFAIKAINPQYPLPLP